MRTIAALTLLAFAAAPLAAQEAAKPAADHQRTYDEAKPGALPEGWNARMDRGADLSNVKFVIMEPGFHFTLGPAGIFWREGDRVNGPFRASATIHQMKAPPHPEGYGLFYGGKALDGEGQQYTYFLVRGDGKYLVKERTGAETKNVTEGWVEHAAIRQQNAEGATANEVAIDATGDEIRFLVNGQVVHSLAAAPGSRNGVVGIRANHNLDLHVSAFEVAR